jgi:hypothetical protein
MHQKEWSRFAAFVAMGVLVGVIVDRWVVGFHVVEPPQPLVAVAPASIEAPTPLVVDDPEPSASVAPLSTKVVDPPRRAATKPSVVARRAAPSATSAPPPLAHTGLVMDVSH